jgi:hypothetical protein
VKDKELGLLARLKPFSDGNFKEYLRIIPRRALDILFA